MNNLNNQHGKNRYRVCILGASLDTGNMGVSALASSLVGLVLREKPEAVIHFLIGNRSSAPQELRFRGRKISVQIANYRLSPRSKIQEHLFWIIFLAIAYRLIPLGPFRRLIRRKNRWLRTLLEADLVGDVNGGDSFSDIYGKKRLVIGIMPSLIAVFLGKKLTLFPQTYGPFKSTLARVLAAYLLKRSEPIVSRDRESVETVKKILGADSPQKKVELCPDVAFTLDAIVPGEIDITPPLNPGRRLIGFNVNGLMYNGGYTRSNMFALKLDYRRYVGALLDRFLDETDDDVLLVPHTFGAPGNVNSDPDACREVLRSLQSAGVNDRVHLVNRQYDQNDIKGIIGLCDFFVGSRMHSCIAALSQGIPTVGLAYSKKFLGVFNSAGIGDLVVDARNLDTERALENTIVCYRNREAMRVTMRDKAAALKAQVRDTFAGILNNGERAIVRS
jgi:colanic acid/amylovoran biosynthesis protein